MTDDENQHVKALKKALGKHAIGKPTFDFHGDNADYRRFLTASLAFENEGVHAYSGQAFNIKDPAFLAIAIATVEARHASVVGLIRNDSQYGTAPDGAFDKPRGATRVLRDVTSLSYITKLSIAGSESGSAPHHAEPSSGRALNRLSTYTRQRRLRDRHGRRRRRSVPRL